MPGQQVVGEMNLVKSQGLVETDEMVSCVSEDILRHETVHEVRETRMTTEGDHVRWTTWLRNRRVAVC